MSNGTSSGSRMLASSELGTAHSITANSSKLMRKTEVWPIACLMPCSLLASCLTMATEPGQSLQLRNLRYYDPPRQKMQANPARNLEKSM